MSWPKTPIKHGHARRGKKLTPTYRTWQAMLNRCHNSSSKSFADYGARGIIVCARWHAFERFLSDMGERPKGMTIEREDSDGNYAPGNCRWATRVEQNSNTRANRYVVFNGARITQAEFARQTGLKQSTVSYRMRSGWTVEQIATMPAHTGNRVASKLGDEADVPEGLA